MSLWRPGIMKVNDWTLWYNGDLVLDRLKSDDGIIRHESILHTVGTW